MSSSDKSWHAKSSNFKSIYFTLGCLNQATKSSTFYKSSNSVSVSPHVMRTSSSMSVAGVAVMGSAVRGWRRWGWQRGWCCQCPPCSNPWPWPSPPSPQSPQGCWSSAPETVGQGLRHPRQEDWRTDSVFVI